MSAICIVSPYHWSAAHGGAEYRADRLSRYLATSAKNTVTYICRAGGAADDYQLVSLRDAPDAPSLRWGYSLDAIRLCAALNEARPDVVLQFVASAYTGIAAAYCRANQIPMVWFVASDSDLGRAADIGVSSPARHLDRAIFRFGARNATHVVVQNGYQASQLRKLYGKETLGVLYSYHEPLQRDAVKGRDFTVVWVGNLKPLKRPELFLELAKETIGHGIRYKMIGRSDQSPWCKQVLREAQAIDGFEYLGELELEEVNEVMEAAHVLVNTSTHEGLPNTFVQAWLREVPSVTMGVDPDGIVSNHGVGRVARNVGEVKQIVLSLQACPQLRRQLGFNARTFAEQHCSMQNAARLAELIKEIADGKSVSSF